MENIMCHECNKNTVLKQDYSQGDLICTECGLVLDSHFIDFRPEWRTMESDLASESRVRVERSPEAFFNDAELFTTISKPPKSLLKAGSDKNSVTMNFDKKMGVPKYHLMEGFNVISTMGDKLALVKTITDRALEIYKMMDGINSLHGQKTSVIAISCLYTACQLEKNDRTFKEIIGAADVHLELRSISQISKKISQELLKMGYSMDKSEMNPAIYARRFCSHLQMNKTDVKAILETIANSNRKLDIRRTPTAIVAATIFMITQLSTHKRKLKEISMATNVGEKTILATYNEISPFTNEIVPQWFQNQLTK